MIRPTTALAFGVAAAAAAGWLLRSREADSVPKPLPASATAPEVPRSSRPMLFRSLDQSDREVVRMNARAWRAELMRSDAALSDAIRLLTDSATNIRVRRSLAIILGSLPGERGKKAVLGALQAGRLEGLERAAILALGIHALEDGREFARDDMPYSVEAAEGLVVYVRDPIPDAGVREELARRLAEAPEPAARHAAALVLRDSAVFPDVREALLSRVGVELSSEAAAESAAAVAGWARRAPPEEGDRPRILARITDALPGGDELFRFRLLSSFGEVAMKPAESARVRTLLEAPDPDLRAFAADVMGRRLEAHPGRDLEAVPALLRTLGGDTSDAVREAAALSLGRALGDPRALEGLVRSLRADPDWEVRAAAARALASHPAPASVQALQEAASSDPRSEVRQAATRSLADARLK